MNIYLSVLLQRCHPRISWLLHPTDGGCEVWSHILSSQDRKLLIFLNMVLNNVEIRVKLSWEESHTFKYNVISCPCTTSRICPIPIFNLTSSITLALLSTSTQAPYAHNCFAFHHHLWPGKPTLFLLLSPYLHCTQKKDSHIPHTTHLPARQGAHQCQSC